MNFDFSDRVGRVEPSATLAISNLASELEAEGEDVVDLSVGAPDFPTPDNIVQAAKDAMDAGHTGYTSSNGIPDLKEAIAAKLRGNGVDAEADEVIVTPGGKQALYETFQTVIDDGDEVVLLDPAWVSYEAMVKLAGGSLNRVDLAQHDFRLEPALDELAEAVSDETKLLVVNSPSNPTGGVFSDAALEGVRDLAVEHDIAVISDEIYERITYDGFEHTSLGSLDGMEDRTITINGFSKAFSMTGWRLGYLHAPSDLISQAGKLHSHSVSCAVNFVQHAGVEALSERTDDTVEEMRQAFEGRRDMLVDLLAEHDVDVAVPKGAFYMMLPVDDDDQAWCEGAIQDAKVATVPGSAFNAPGYARISYAASEERLREAVERLAEHDYI
ncbi:pyridoxal phosphate-dependent aminotransferase [Haloferax mediterranei ATCC 33500]|uniref:Aminotransferase n=1 Tax=Haloferax mediterranei (strain ATCC 33500 / DSM 1411 / JCM 8866 / NBRC 14739 / NCIMB 2177 / R-4) TaxID=523841 RepID=I3R379_HALMT|nr:pyridoxal phosphate-dependent aminotransferase [Haloferax mediterranei]AFK18689.1 aspartate aminotransferase [Haloferax mediterranei ATCC 33500]AHZ21941.1 aspartate aminotransferase [Haloferax mediterranei ATCC 33500]EMA03450.1 aspartate aminotransferase [Haloferax mediterranei ATCC 33500]MDX5988786.1 pyridoxal phosphate-dependent aminotransferase [Haloferax mediterranei ATCC 33500]QCQ75189.1 pyridoxal phosphate-dependent aminotransferase [Haloferax mediterranei ATCC 33500]